MLATVETQTATTLSNCTAFQTLVGASSAAQALTRIYRDAIPPPKGNTYTAAELAALRPYALVYCDTETGLEYLLNSADVAFNYAARGTVNICIVASTPSSVAHDEEAVTNNFKTTVDSILANLLELGGGGGELAWKRLRVRGPVRIFSDEWTALKDSMTVWFEIDWGQQE